jgi:glycosyltransferase involved in cell wall biosynthesis
LAAKPRRKLARSRGTALGVLRASPGHLLGRQDCCFIFKVVVAVIPALNEEPSIGKVIEALRKPLQQASLPEHRLTSGLALNRILVVDNGSSDATAQVAKAAGAEVLHEKERGYGAACLCGIQALPQDTHVVLFLDGDFSDHPEEWPTLVSPILENRADLVIGSRVRGHSEKGALLPVARFGNWLSTALIRFIWGEPFTDLGPFRAISFAALKRLGMRDRNFGWTVEMQIKAAALGLRCHEVPVSYRKRIGVSKISGTVKGSFKAGTKILYLIFREAGRAPLSRRFSKGTRPP